MVWAFPDSLPSIQPSIMAFDLCPRLILSLLYYSSAGTTYFQFKLGHSRPQLAPQFNKLTSCGLDRWSRCWSASANYCCSASRLRRTRWSAGPFLSVLLLMNDADHCSTPYEAAQL